MNPKLMYAENDRFIQKHDAKLFNKDEIMDNLAENHNLILTGHSPQLVVFYILSIVFLGYVTIGLSLEHQQTDDLIVFLIMIGAMIVTITLLLQNLHHSVSILMQVKKYGSVENAYQQLLENGQISQAKITGFKRNELQIEFVLDGKKYKESWTFHFDRGHVAVGDSIYIIHHDTHFAVI